MRRNGDGIGARKEKGRSEKRVKRGGRKEIGDRIFRSLDVCGSQSVLKPKVDFESRGVAGGGGQKRNWKT